jgi:hypothetical protein
LAAESDGMVNEAATALILMDLNHLAWLRARPLDERLAHLDSPIPHFREQVAASGDLPADVAARLDADDDLRIRRTVARRADVPGDVLERLVREHGVSVKGRPMLVEHPNYPKDAFARLATSPDPARRALALQGDLPADLVAAPAAGRRGVRAQSRGGASEPPGRGPGRPARGRRPGCGRGRRSVPGSAAIRDGPPAGGSRRLKDLGR